MSLQFGVTPSGVLEADPARGMLVGNRGRLLHKKTGDRVLRWEGTDWITCLIFYGPEANPRGREYTELSFLDEATACAAGHRPCGRCRRPEMEAFHAQWVKRHAGDKLMRQLDARLHRERTGRRELTAACAKLPDGVMVSVDGRPWLVIRGELRAWTRDGYKERQEFRSGLVTVLTPPSTVDVMKAWQPGLHPSALS